jgi:hypothetical protein
MFSWCYHPARKKIPLCLSRTSATVFGKRYIDIWYTIVLERLELINVVLPAEDIVPPFQTASFFSFFSITRSQSFTCILLGLTGTPKYFIWETTYLVVEKFSQFNTFLLITMNQDHFTLGEVDLKPRHHFV